MGRTLGEDMALLLGFGANLGVSFGVVSQVLKRLGWPAIVAIPLALGVCLAFSMGWLLLCERFCQGKTRERRYGLRFVLLHWAPTAAVFLAATLLAWRR